MRLITPRLTDDFVAQVRLCTKELCISVPFLSTFVKRVLTNELLNAIPIKKLITRLDDSTITSFDLDALAYLLDNGFKIRYDNSLHSKVYLFEREAWFGSSNFTAGGFENNLELNIRCTDTLKAQLKEYFDNHWVKISHQQITDETIKTNWSKYLILKLRRPQGGPAGKESVHVEMPNGEENALFDAIFIKDYGSYGNRLPIVQKSIKYRDNFIELVEREGYHKHFFYAPSNHEWRYKCLFYEITYGHASKLAGTNLRDKQFATITKHPDFQKAVEFIYPPMVGRENWNLADEVEYGNFCNEIFHFNISEYKETAPIRLASFFHPEYFLPIFKVQQLQELANALGAPKFEGAIGRILFELNRWLIRKLSEVPQHMLIKCQMAYQYSYAMEVLNHFEKGISIEEYQQSLNKAWKKDYAQKGHTIASKLRLVS